MITKSYEHRHYDSALQRFLKPAIITFFEKSFPRVFGPLIQEKIADELILLFNSISPESSRLKPGQILWMAVHKNTRADSIKRKFVPVILTLVSENDIKQLSNGVKHSLVIQEAKARMYKEAYEQMGLLSTRDMSLISMTPLGKTSSLRIAYEKQNNCVLPHTGALQDVGSTITHKNIILRKIIIEKKDPAFVAKECNHSQRAVDHYLKDYYRIKSLVSDNKDIDFIHQVTGIARYVIKQYLEIINENY